MVHATKPIMLKARLLYTAKILFHVLGEFGYNPIKMVVSILELPLYIYQLTSFSIRSKSPVKIRLFPYLKERIEFNGHRIFSVTTILNLTTSDYDLVSFSYIDDTNTLYENVDTSFVPTMLYGCGLYELKKK